MKQVVYGIGGYNPKKKNNNIVEELELDDPPQQPLNDSGALATLMVVNGLIDINDAANAVRQAPEALIAEAQAWAVASTL